MTDALWQLGGWTMIHFLWLGTAAALVGAALRFACRRAAPNTRYAVSLLTLAALTALPIAIATWLSLNSPAILAGRTALTATMQPRALPGGSATIERDPASTPGQRPRLQNAAPPVVIDLAHTPPPPQQTLPLPSPRRGGVGGEVSSTDDAAISASTITVAAIVTHLPWLWLIGAPLTFALLASGLVGSERLRRKCTALTDGPAAAACEQLRQAMRITRRVSVAACDHLAQPVLIGILRPLILLPASALSGWTPAELEMVLVHELAHVRRWDNLVNLLQRIIESALFFHPAVWLISRQVRRDREECCDAVVVSRIQRPHDYAALLVSIAASRSRLSAQPSLAAASAMADHPLTGRIRRILKLEDEPMWISRRTLALTLALPLLLVAAAIYGGAAAQDPPPSQGGARGGIEPEGRPPQVVDAATPGERSGKWNVPASTPAVAENDSSNAEADPPSASPALADRVDPTEQAVVYTIKPAAVKAMQPYVAENARRLGLWGYEWAGDYGSITITSNEKNQARFREIISQKGWLEHAEVINRQLEATVADPEVEIPKLQTQIKRLEDQITEANKELVNVEVFKQLASEKARSPEAVEKAVAAILDQDPTLARSQQKKSELQKAVQEHQDRYGNPNSSQLKQLIQQLRQTEQEMQQHRAALEKSAREQIAKMPNEAYRAAIVEHKIRYEAATANLKKYTDELDEANRKLNELVRSNSGGKETDDPIYAIVYPVADVETIDFQRWMQLVSSDKRIEVRWFEKNKSLVVNAPKSGHEQISDLLSETRDKSGDPGVEGRLGVAAHENQFDNDLTRTAPLAVDEASTAPTATSSRYKLQWQQEVEAAERAIAKNGKFILLYFHSNGSAPCKAFNKSVLESPKTRAAIDRDYELVKVEVGQAPQLASHYDITSVPAAVVISTNESQSVPCLNRDDFVVRLSQLREMLAQPAAGGESKEKASGDRPLQPGDRVMIQVVGAFPERPIHGVFSIEPTGTVALGATYGRVDIAGQTLVEAEAAVSKHLATILSDAAVQVTFAATAEAPPADRPLQPHDSVMIEVLGAFPEQPIDNVYTIEPAGTVALGPTYGRVQIAGQTILEAQAGVEKHLETILSDAKVQLTLHERAPTESQPPTGGNATYLYDGKTFDDWRSLWKHELNTNRRTEAIEALAAFARAGYGKEAAETILDVAGEYAFNSSYKSPEGKLEQRVTQVLTLGRASRVPATDWLPALMDRHAKDPDKWRPLLAMLISGGVPEKDYTLDQATRKSLLQIASDPKYGPNAAALRSLYSRSYTDKGDPISDPEVAPLIKAALAGEDVGNALAVLRMLSFGQLDQWPEQLDFLFHEDAAARRTARTILQWSSSRSRQAVADRLIAVLDDPKRAEDHADAIRALGVLLHNNNRGEGSKSWPDEETHKRFSERFEQITRNGPSELLVPAIRALGVLNATGIDNWLRSMDARESEEYKERIKQARDKIEAETEHLVDPPNLGGGMGGGGMGGRGGF